MGKKNRSMFNSVNNGNSGKAFVKDKTTNLTNSGRQHFFKSEPKIEQRTVHDPLLDLALTVTIIQPLISGQLK